MNFSAKVFFFFFSVVKSESISIHVFLNFKELKSELWLGSFLSKRHIESFLSRYYRNHMLSHKNS